MANCIDLKKRFGDRYQIRYEESYHAERGDGGRVTDPWLAIIQCLHGHIYPQGGDLLAASTNHRGEIAGRLEKLECVRVVQDGADGVNVVFHLDHFDQVAAIMKPRLRRRLTPSQRLEQTDRLRSYRFGSATHDAGGDRRRNAADSADSESVFRA